MQHMVGILFVDVVLDGIGAVLFEILGMDLHKVREFRLEFNRKSVLFSLLSFFFLFSFALPLSWNTGEKW